MSNLHVVSGHIPPRGDPRGRPPSPSGHPQPLAAADLIESAPAPLPSWGGSGPRTTLPQHPRSPAAISRLLPRTEAVDAACAAAQELTGHTGGETYDLCRQELEGFSINKQRELVAMTRRMVSQAGEGRGRPALAWLRAVARPNYRLACHLAQAMDEAGLRGTDISSFHALQALLERLDRRQHAACAKEAARLGTRPTTGEHQGRVMMHCLGLMADARSERQQREMAHFLAAWLPTGKLAPDLFMRAATLLAKLEVNQRSLWREALGDVLSFAAASSLSITQLFGRLQQLSERHRGLAPRLRMLLAPEVDVLLARLTLAERLPTLIALLKMHGDLSEQAALLLRLGGNRHGPQAPGCDQVVSMVVGTAIDRNVGATRQFADAAQGLCRRTPAQAQLALMRLLACQSANHLAASGAALTTLVVRLLSPSPGRPGGVTLAQLRGWADRLQRLSPPPSPTLWRLCAGPQMQTACLHIPQPTVLALLEEALMLSESRDEEAITLVQSARRLAGDGSTQMAALAAILREQEEDLSAVTRFCEPFCRRAMGEDLPALLTTLCAIPSEMRETFADICRPLLGSDMPNEVVGYLIDFCALSGEHLSQTPSDMAARWRSSLAQCLSFHPNRLPDGENVQSHLRIDRTRAAILALLARHGPSEWSQRQATHRAIEAYVSSWRRRPADCPAAAVLARQWAADDVVGHALRVLNGPAESADLTKVPLITPRGPTSHLALHDAGHIGMDELAHLVWCAIGAYPGPPGGGSEERAREQNNMRYSYMLALAHCVEEAGADFGKLVCPVGVSQRLMQVLQGYDGDTHIDAHTPQQLLSTLGQRFAQEAGDSPSPAAVAAFRRQALAEVSGIYPAGSAEFGCFSAELDAWLEMV